MRNRRSVILAAFACLAVASVALAIRSNRERPPELPAGSIASLEFNTRIHVVPPVPDTEIRDASNIEGLAGAIRRGEPTSDHKCGETARLVFRRKDRSEVRIGLLPGHDARFYEFRVFGAGGDSMFRVDRESFLKAMAGLGVTRLDPGQPE